MVGDDIQITLNKDLVFKRHRDHATKEHPWIMWIVDFAGGALNFDDGAKIEGKREWHDPHEVTKYSIVLYRGTRNPKNSRAVEAKRAKREKNLQA